MQDPSPGARLTSNAFFQTAFLTAVSSLVFAFRLRKALAGDGSLFRGYDGAIQSYPWLVKVMTGWRTFDLSLWDFGTFSGTSFVGELQTGVFYPLTAVWAWIAPPGRFWLEAFIVFHHGLAFAFMTLFCRRVKLSWPASLLAALAFSSYLDWSQPNRMFGMVFLPLLLYLFLRALEDGRLLFNPWVFAGGAALACALLAGHHQPPIHAAFCLAAFAALTAIRRENLGTALAALSAIGLSAVLFSAPQLWLSWEYLSDAYRWTPERIPALSQISYQQYGFENTLNPQLLLYFSLSWIPLAAVAAAFLLWADRSPDRKRLARFGLIVGAFSLLASLGHATPIGRLTWHVPVLNWVRETERFLFPFLFAASTLLAVSLDGVHEALRARWPESRRWTGWTLFGAAAILLWWHSSPFLYVQPPGDPLSPSLLYPDLSREDGSPAQEALRFLRDRALEDRGQCRVLNFKDALAPNLGDVYPIHTTTGHRATMHAPYFDFLKGHQGNPLSTRFDELGVCYLVANEKFDLPILLDLGELSIYRRPGALPVFRLVDTATAKATAIAGEQIDWRAGRVDLKLAQPVQGRLVFAQLRYPGWDVLVDGRKREMADSGPFPTVDLTPADRAVSFVYRPSGLPWAAAAAALPLLALVASLAVARSRKRASMRIF